MADIVVTLVAEEYERKLNMARNNKDYKVVGDEASTNTSLRALLGPVYELNTTNWINRHFNFFKSTEPPSEIVQAAFDAFFSA